MTIRIGVDTGGTFTDLLCLDEHGLRVHKLRSIPDDPSRAILAGIRALLGPALVDEKLGDQVLVKQVRANQKSVHPFLDHELSVDDQVPVEQLPANRVPTDQVTAGEKPVNQVLDRKLAICHQLHALEVTHGSTVATNAVLERKGARLALITTAGFEDILRIGRQTRPQLYSFMVRRPEPLVAPELTFGLPERLAADGAILEPLHAAALQTLIATLHHQQIESVAICLLHSYANPVHEAAAAQAFRRAGFRVSASHEILPEYREYERWSTTVVNAYVAPLMARYLTRLQQGLGTGTLRIMQSNGGSISAARASSEAVQTILSGPAAGVVGAQAMGSASGFSKLITFDMGGTSTDVSLLDGAISTIHESLVGDLPVRLPVLDIHTVGAGGGSVAWIDTGGSLRVGPRSAGANPGPACFGVGEELTVTDANLLLGRLDPDYFLGGRITLDLARTQHLAASLADSLNLDPVTLAEGILRIANANMERAVRVVSVQRGFDPRDFALLAFGGAGGLHACDLAASLDIATVLIPEHSGVLSALGMLLADVAKDYSASVLQPASASPVGYSEESATRRPASARIDEHPATGHPTQALTTPLTLEDLRTRLAPLTHRALADLAAEGFAPADITLAASLAMRYQGQAYEIDVPLPKPFSSSPESPWNPPVAVDRDLVPHLVADFHQRHAKLYGYSNPARPTEAVQLRLRATGHTIKPEIVPPITPPTATQPATPIAPQAATQPPQLAIHVETQAETPTLAGPNSTPPLLPEPDAIRPTLFAGQSLPTPVYHRSRLAPGMGGQGPAILITGESTNVLPPGWSWRIDPAGTLIARRDPASQADPQTDPDARLFWQHQPAAPTEEGNHAD
jgi:N-methylhydantoinase A/oxoprolinase/acetone carboxylase beta subunit